MKYTTPIYITAAARSPIGRFGGALKDVSPADLATQLCAALPHEAAQSVIFGQVLQAGAGMNVARQIVLKLGLPQSTPAFTVNKVCGSGLKAVALGANEIALGENEVVLAGGVEVMSRAPFYATQMRWGRKLGDATLSDAITHDGLTDAMHGILMGETAERMAEKFDISRAEQDEYALQSQSRAAASQENFAREIVPIQTAKGVFEKDEGPRADTTLEKLGALKPAFRNDGTVTPGNASTLNDGAAAVLLCGGTSVERLGLTPRARIVGAASAGCDPCLMGLGPIQAIRRLCETIGWKLEDVDAIELNEAFASQVLTATRELPIDAERLNIRGGAIALGHPIGASGARVLVTLLHILEDNDWKRGIAALCIGGGMGIAMAIERD